MQHTPSGPPRRLRLTLAMPRHRAKKSNGQFLSPLDLRMALTSLTEILTDSDHDANYLRRKTRIREAESYSELIPRLQCLHLPWPVLLGQHWKPQPHPQSGGVPGSVRRRSRASLEAVRHTVSSPGAFECTHGQVTSYTTYRLQEHGGNLLFLMNRGASL
jgi:hypothetical protein